MSDNIRTKIPLDPRHKYRIDWHQTQEEQVSLTVN